MFNVRRCPMIVTFYLFIFGVRHDRALGLFLIHSFMDLSTFKIISQSFMLVCRHQLLKLKRVSSSTGPIHHAVCGGELIMRGPLSSTSSMTLHFLFFCTWPLWKRVVESLEGQSVRHCVSEFHRSVEFLQGAFSYQRVWTFCGFKCIVGICCFRAETIDEIIDKTKVSAGDVGKACVVGEITFTAY